MALRRRVWSIWTIAKATLYGSSGSFCRSCSTVPRYSSTLFEHPNWQSPLQPSGEHTVRGQGYGARGLQNFLRYYSNAALGTFNLCPFIQVREYYEFTSLGARADSRKTQNVGTSIGMHFRHYGTKNLAEDSEKESEDEGAASENRSDTRDKSVKWHVDRLCPTSLRIRQLKEQDFDDIIEREKKLKIVLKVRDLLLADSERFMSFQDLGKCRDHIGLKGNKRIIAFLRVYPGVFKLHETVEEGKLPWFELTPEAEAIGEEEAEIRKNIKVELVTKLRKLLMMSCNRRLLLAKIAHIARDLGLPEDFRSRFVHRYPKYFKVLEGEDPTNEEGRSLELVKWSDRLAVTEAEQKIQDIMQESGADSPPRLEIQLPYRYRLSNKDKYVIYKFHELGCPSPYQSSSHLDPSSAEAEKRAVLVVKELLSLTLEKRVYVDHLTHFRKEFKFSNQVRGLLIRHPEHFYVSRKGARETVFMREAYERIHESGRRQEQVLKVKHPLVNIKEKFADLLEVKRVPATQQGANPSQEIVVRPQESLSSPEEMEYPSQESAHQCLCETNGSN